MAKVQMDAGGSGSGSWIAGAGFTGGTPGNNPTGPPYYNTGNIDPAPDAVNATALYDGVTFSKTLAGLVVGQTYRFRVHSTWYNTDYSFRVKANGVDKGSLSFSQPTDNNVVRIVDFTAVPDGSGQIILVFEKITTFVLITALEWWQVTGGAAVPSDVTGFAAAAGVGAGVSLSWNASTDDLAVHHYRIERDTVNTFDSPDLETINTSDYEPRTYFELLDPETEYFYRIKAVDGDGGLSASWATDSVTTTSTDIKINCGGPLSGDWVADIYWVDPESSDVVLGPFADADLTGLVGPAPTAIYNYFRLSSAGTIKYSIPSLKPNGVYLIRLHFRIHVAGVFAQYIQAEGKNVSQTTYDIGNKGRIREFYTTVGPDGILDLTFFYNAGNNSYIAGIEANLVPAIPTDAVTTNIVILGDSITCGHPYWDNSYPYLLAELLDGNAYKFDSPQIFDATNIQRVDNLGISGEALATMSARFNADVVPRIRPAATNVFMLLGGANDLGTSAGAIQTSIQNICTAARTAGYDFILASTITARSDQTGAGETTRTTANDWIRANWASFADGLVDFAGNPEFDDLDGPNYSDEAVKVHYSEAGNAIAAQMVFDALEALDLPEPPEPPMEPTFPGPSVNGILWEHFNELPRDFAPVTISHTYEDEGRSFNETTLTPAQRWEIIYTGLTYDEMQIYEAFARAFRLTQIFEFKDKWDVVHTGVRVESYERSHNRNISWAHNVRFILCKYP